MQTEKEWNTVKWKKKPTATMLMVKTSVRNQTDNVEEGEKIMKPKKSKNVFFCLKLKTLKHSPSVKFQKNPAGQAKAILKLYPTGHTPT